MDTSSSVDLPDEIIEVILSKCPIKSVGRFKSVSKSWRSIISGSRFSRVHLIQRSKVLQDQKAFFLWERQRHYGYDYGLHVIRLEENEDFRIKSESLRLGYPASCGEYSFDPLCSCNGLILLFTDKKEYILWNPLVRKHIVIPAFNPNTHRKAFRKWPAPKTQPYPHPRPHTHIYHDSVTDDYKIVFHYEIRRCYTVYSCRNGSWGEIKDFPDLHCEECVYGVEGSCLYGMCDGNTKIISFDARDEKVHGFPLPEGVECLVEVKLEALSGRLCLYGGSNYDNQLQRLHLWVMEESGSFDKSWRKLIGMEKEELHTEDIYLTYQDEVDLRAWFSKLVNELNPRLNCDAHFMYNPHEIRSPFLNIFDPFCWDAHRFLVPYLENLDMPYSNTPPSAPDKRRKGRNYPISCEGTKRPKKGR